MEQIRKYLNDCFDEYVMNDELESLREELFANVSDHYEDLVRQTGSAEEAEETVLASLGDIKGLLQEIGAQKKVPERPRVNSIDNDLIREFSDSFNNLFAGAFRSRDTDGIRNEVYANIESLDVRGINMDIVIKPSRDELLHVEAEGNQDAIEFEVDDETLEIRELPRSGIFRSGMDLSLEIPEELNTLDVQVVSGDLSMDHLKLDTVRFHSTSGDLSVRHCSINDLQTVSTSGDMYIRVNELGQYLGELESGDVDLKCISAGSVSCTCRSGDIDAEIADTFDAVWFKTVSGDVSVKLGCKEDISMDLNTISGSIDAGNRITSEGKPVAVRTVSGDIRIRR